MIRGIKEYFGFVNKPKRTIGKKGIGRLKDDDVIYSTLRQILANNPTTSDPYAKSAWVYSSIRTIARNVARVPFRIYKDVEVDSPLQKVEIKKGKLIDVLRNPNPLMTLKGLIEATIIYLEHYGEAFWILDDRNNITEVPKEIWTFSPKRFTPEVDSMGRISGWRYKKTSSDEGTLLPVHQVLYFRYFNPYDDIRGISPLSAAQLSVDQDYYANEYNKNFFKNGASVGSIIEVEEELGDVAYKHLLSQLEDRHEGFANAHKIAILEGGAKWKDMGIGQKDIDFVNLKNTTRDEVYSTFNTNSVIHGFFDNVKSFEGMRAAHKAFWEEALIPTITYIEEIINEAFIKKLSGGFIGEFDLSNVEALRDDFTKKTNTAWLLYRMGFPINMINKRLSLGMSDVDWGNDGWTTNNSAPFSELPIENAKQVPKNTDSRPEDNADKPQDNTTDEKSIKTYNKFPEAYYRYNGMCDIMEKRFHSKISRFLFEQRKTVIENLYHMSDNVSVMTSTNLIEHVFPEKEVAKLKDILKPLYSTSVKIGAEMVAGEIGFIDFVFDKFEFEYTINSRINVIPDEIVSTIKKHLNQALIESVDNGDSIEDIVNKIKKVYNFATIKSKVIAKTETKGTINDGRFSMMNKYNINKHKWLHTGDKIHQNLNNKEVKIGDSFDNSNTRYPFDLTSDSFDINCTCITLPIKEENK